GMTENRIVVFWDPAHPTEIQEKPFLDRSLPVAAADHVQIVFSVQPRHPTDVAMTPGGARVFADYLALLARTYPQVRQFIVGNEPNQPRFWRPQFSASGRGVAAAAYEQLLALSYDALLKGSRWPNAGVPNFARIKQAVWDAFAGTAQPTFAERGRFDVPPLVPAPTKPLTLVLDETGWQARIPAFARAAYTGRENSKTVGERTQARIYGDLVRFVECDPAVTELNLFHLGDEKDLGRFQSGLVHADGSHRPSYDAVKAAIAETRGLCTGTSVAWRHSTAVAGASADFGRRAHGRLGFAVTAQEAASVRAGIFRVGSSRGLSERDREWVAAALASNMATPGLVSRASSGARAYWRTDMTVGGASLSAWAYAYTVRFAAPTNT